MTNSPRQSVHIPDHDVLRKIGGGAYGEVWLARGVTGAWRAVKVVRREDFEDERGFEREFDGILQYEPISRDHPALVNVLHVGRTKNDHDTFYYYVMELGDDFHTGMEINAVEYEARTLRSDLVSADGVPLDLDFCLDVAVRLSDALAYLHERGLAHRDVKPANVIFVGGKAKLADIGLVAPRDQRTFVGTEGFVPPEGPGSSQADLYSLGKVLYEMMTGKDRLQFPELPDDLPSGEKRKLWLEMNQLICDICEPKQSKRKITTALALSQAVQRLQQGKKARSASFAGALKLTLVSLLFLLGAYGLFVLAPWEIEPPVVVVKDEEIVTKSEKLQPVIEDPDLPENEYCSVSINTTPPHAIVYENGELLEQLTPTEFRDFKPGTVITYKLVLDGYKEFEETFTVPDQKTLPIYKELEVFRPPVENQVWRDSLGMEYSPRDGYHVSGFLRSSHYDAFIADTKSEDLAKRIPFSESGEGIEIVLLTVDQAKEYVKWLEQEAIEAGLLMENQMLSFKQELDLAANDFTTQNQVEGLLATRLIVKEIQYASVALKSVPSGAKVYLAGEMVGVTPMLLENIRPGDLALELRMDGYQKYEENVAFSDDEEKAMEVLLRPNDGVIFDVKWVNTLGQPMVPIRPKLMAAAWETRVSDYQSFIKDSGHRAPKDPGFRQTGDHPVVGVSRQDAMAFCEWLTKKERLAERISEQHRYKLPSDIEWSELAGLSEDAKLYPSERDHQAQKDETMKDLFLWGDEFPPSKKLANLADETAAKAVGVTKSRTLANYNDGYEMTAPVGSFPASSLGLHDVCGNVYEWVESSYKDGSPLAISRGGSWASFTKTHLRVWSRFPMSPSIRDNQFGFRVVLVDESEALAE